jgi:hypothetical protein
VMMLGARAGGARLESIIRTRRCEGPYRSRQSEGEHDHVCGFRRQAVSIIFAGALFSRSAGVQLINVPYKGGPQALTRPDRRTGADHVCYRGHHAQAKYAGVANCKALGVSTSKAHCTAARNTDDCGIRPAGLAR